jgi:hypothetical protein
MRGVEGVIEGEAQKLAGHKNLISIKGSDRSAPGKFVLAS